jgi:hypothetical protein
MSGMSKAESTSDPLIDRSLWSGSFFFTNKRPQRWLRPFNEERKGRKAKAFEGRKEVFFVGWRGQFLRISKRTSQPLPVS